MTRVLVVALAVLPSLASAQLCAGTPSFTEGRMRITAGGQFNKSAKAFTFGLGMGGRALFGDVVVSNVRFDDLGAAAYAFGVGAGSQFSLGRERRAQICPTASISYLNGPKDLDPFGDGSVLIDLAETDISFGISLGAMVNRSSDSPILATASAAVANSMLRERDEDASGTTTTTTSETYGILGVGVGFIFSRAIGLQIGSSIPVGLEGATASFGFTISVNFGRKG